MAFTQDPERSDVTSPSLSFQGAAVPREHTCDLFSRVGEQQFDRSFVSDSRWIGRLAGKSQWLCSALKHLGQSWAASIPLLPHATDRATLHCESGYNKLP